MQTLTNTISQSGGAAEQAAVLDLLLAAFVTDAATRCLYPAEAAYRAHFPGFLLVLGGRAFDAGAVDNEAAGAALWVAPGVKVDGDIIGAHLEATISVERLPQLVAGMEMQGRLHPQVPHWYLPWIVVRPEALGQGIGGALLRHGLARADHDGLPTYLEATSRRNAALYARHGFDVLGVIDAPGYPEIIAMWRPARSRA